MYLGTCFEASWNMRAAGRNASRPTRGPARTGGRGPLRERVDDTMFGSISTFLVYATLPPGLPSTPLLRVHPPSEFAFCVATN